MSDYDPMAELELETDHPTSSLITFAIENYGWKILPEYSSLIHSDYQRMAAQWKQCEYHGQDIVYPNWFKRKLLEQIKQKADTMEQNGQGWAEPQDDFAVDEATEDFHHSQEKSNPSFIPRSKTYRGLFEQTRTHHPACGCGACCALSGWSQEDENQALGREEVKPLPLPNIHKNFKATAKQLEEDEQFKQDHGAYLDSGLTAKYLYKSFGEIQIEVGNWALQFGENESHDTRYHSLCPGCDGSGEVKTPKQPKNPRTAWDDKVEYIHGTCSECKGTGSVPTKLQSLPPLLGMVEELGEITAPVLKRHQGRGFMDEAEYHNAVYDGLGDLMIFMCDFANREGINLNECLAKTWDKVQNRNQATWQSDKDKETTAQMVFDPDLAKRMKELYQVKPADQSETTGTELSEVDKKLLRESYDPQQTSNTRLTKDGVEVRIGNSPITSQRRLSSYGYICDELDEYIKTGCFGDFALSMIDKLNTKVPSVREELYQRVSAIGLQYGDQNLTNIEEGLLKRLMLIAEDAEARLHGRDAREIRVKLNELRKLRPDILGEQKESLEKKTKIDYSEYPNQSQP